MDSQSPTLCAVHGQLVTNTKCGAWYIDGPRVWEIDHLPGYWSKFLEEGRLIIFLESSGNILEVLLKFCSTPDLAETCVNSTLHRLEINSQVKVIMPHLVALKTLQFEQDWMSSLVVKVAWSQGSRGVSGLAKLVSLVHMSVRESSWILQDNGDRSGCVSRSFDSRSSFQFIEGDFNHFQ